MGHAEQSVPLDSIRFRRDITVYGNASTGSFSDFQSSYCAENLTRTVPLSCPRIILVGDTVPSLENSVTEVETRPVTRAYVGVVRLKTAGETAG